MVYVLTENFTDEPIGVALSSGAGPGDERVRIKVGATVIRLDIAEAVDLIDRVTVALGAQADVREAL